MRCTQGGEHQPCWHERCASSTELTQSALRHLPASALTAVSLAGADFPALKSKARPVLTSLLHFFSSSLRAGGNPDHVRSDLQAMGLGSDKVEHLASSFLSQFASLSASAASRTLSAAQLVDVSWKFGVSASSSEAASMGSCFLQLQLTVERGGKKEQRLMGQTRHNIA